jgi:hypothetical protein
VLRDKERMAKEAEEAEARRLTERARAVLASIPDLADDAEVDDVLEALNRHPALQPGGEFAGCHDLYLLEAASARADECAKAEEEARKAVIAADRRALRHSREGFEALLAELAMSGSLHPRSMWKEHSAVLIADPRCVVCLFV